MNLTSYMPVKIIGKSGCLRNSSDELKKLGKRCFIVTSGSAARKSGALDDAISALNESGIEYEIFSKISQNPLTDECFEAGEKARLFGADFILGIGGGSPLDAAKAAAIYATNPQMSAELIYQRNGSNPPIPVALVGTTAGTGSEITGVSVLTNSLTGCKKSISGPDCYAKISFCDARYTESMPFTVTVSSALDAFSHCIESYFASDANEISDSYALGGAEIIWKHLQSFAQGQTQLTPKDREELYAGSILGGLAINITGTCFPHTVGYVLTEQFAIPHGRACTAFFGEYIDLSVKHRADKADKLFKELNTCQERLCSVIDSLTAVNIKMSPEQIEAFAQRWKNGVKNFERTPGSFTWETAKSILSKYIG